MAHVHTAPGQHDHTVGAYIVRLDTPEPSLMLHWHKKRGRYLHFGGHIELSETPWQALGRELREESGHDIAQLYILQPAKRIKKLPGAQLHPVPVSLSTHKYGELDHYHTDIAFALVADSSPRWQVTEEESSEIRLVTAAKLKSLTNDEIPEDVRAISLFVLEECLANWTKVAASAFQKLSIPPQN